DKIMGAYVFIFRGTPMMVQAMIILYGSMQYLGISIPVIFASIIVISVNTGAYMAEIIRGGIISIDPGQSEGAHSLGMNHWQTMTGIVLPQAIRNSMPSIGNEFVVNIKDSSVLNVISMSELFFVSKSASGTYLKYFEVFFITAIIYLMLTATVTFILRKIEKRMDGPDNFKLCVADDSTKIAADEGGQLL
ncbi:MAG: amino acid ABC transporter permease, partial [Clostridiales bacterium]|nr:amino acid ABC transporter permease [Clostridiales bacterium]